MQIPTAGHRNNRSTSGGTAGPRWSRTRAGLVGAGFAAAAVTAAGCSSSTPQANHSGGDTVHGASAATHVVQAAYTKTTAAKTAKISVSVGGGQGTSSAGQQVSLTGTGVINFGSRAADVTMALPNGIRMEVRYLTGAEYLRSTPAAAMSKLTGSSRAWAKLDLDKLVKARTGKTLQQLQQATPSDPSTELADLRGVSGKVKKLGPATIAGTRTTGYQTTVDLAKVAARQGGTAKANLSKLEGELGGHTIPIKVWIDDQGRLRRLTTTETIKHPASAAAGTQTAPVSIHLTETLSDYGTPATITAPPAGQTTDITDKLTNAAGMH